MFVHGEPSAEPVDQCERECRHESQSGEEVGLQHGAPDADVAHAICAVGELAGFQVGPSEQLDQGGTGSGEPLGHLRRHARVVLGCFT